MIFNAADFIYEPELEVSRARKILIKPCATSPLPYPMNTSRELLATVIHAIRSASDADVILLEGPGDGEQTRAVCRALGYDFPRVLGLDVRDCSLVEVENPLPKPFAIANFWVPNVLLSCDYLISIAPFKVLDNQAWLTTANLLSLLPRSKYGETLGRDGGLLARQEIQAVLADLYFTVPFDLGVVEAGVKLFYGHDAEEGRAEECGRIFVSDPFTADMEAVKALAEHASHLDLIASARTAFEALSDQ